MCSCLSKPEDAVGMFDEVGCSEHAKGGTSHVSIMACFMHMCAGFWALHVHLLLEDQQQLSHCSGKTVLTSRE